jgi:hypothetical protein
MVIISISSIFKKILYIGLTFFEFLSPIRISIPYFATFVFVFDPKQIKNISTNCKEINRIGVVQPTSRLIKFVLSTTRQYDHFTDKFPMLNIGEYQDQYRSRRNDTDSKLAQGYSETDIEEVANMIYNSCSDVLIAHKIVNIVIPRFINKRVPFSIVEAESKTSNVGFDINGLIFRNRSKNNVTEVNQFAHSVDHGSFIGSIVFTVMHYVKLLKDNPKQNLLDMIHNESPTNFVMSMAIEPTNLDGIMWYNIPENSNIFFLTGYAAYRTQDTKFIFGRGNGDRLCCFMSFFLSFISDLQNKLIQ